MKRIRPILCGAAIAMGLLGCGGSEPEEAAPEKSAEQIAAEQEAARRADATSALEVRASEIAEAVSELGGGSDLPESLAATVAQVDAAQEGVERLVAELGQASGEDWEVARSRLEAALDDLQASREPAEEAIADWRRREAEALAERESAGSPIDPDSGLIIGLDGGDYERYLPRAVERAQARLRELGRYAGPVDGTLGKPTMAAIGEFQRQHGLQVSGVPSPMTRSRLYAEEP